MKNSKYKKKLKERHITKITSKQPKSARIRKGMAHIDLGLATSAKIFFKISIGKEPRVKSPALWWLVIYIPYFVLGLSQTIEL